MPAGANDERKCTITDIIEQSFKRNLKLYNEISE